MTYIVKVAQKVYSLLRQTQNSIRMQLLGLFLAELGHGSLISRHCVISTPSNLKIGKNVFVNEHCMLNAEGGLTIGDDTKIGPYTTIWTSNHKFSRRDIPIRAQGNSFAPVTIENDVWVGANVTIVAGVRIAEGAVVGASSVVTRDVEKFTVVAGNPAKLLKTRP